MKHVIMKIVAGLFLSGLCFASSCQKEVKTDTNPAGNLFTLNVAFQAVVDNTPLQFDKSYTNIFQEAYAVKTFKYYVSSIELINSESDKTYEVEKNNYFLVDEASAGSATLALKAGPDKYDRISFIIGVDSARNVSGAQTGALDPANGMFWTWNSGYIMAKLEGTSPLSNQPNNRIEYHIGGFKKSENVLKKIVLPFPAAVNFQPNSTATITITANVNAWFNNPNDLRIAATPVCMTPGDLSKQIAANYSKMFTLTQVVNN